VVFWRSANSDGWRALNVSAEAGRTVTAGSALTSWTSVVNAATVEHISAIGADGNLLVFRWTSAAGRWQVTDATAESGRKVVGSLTDWLGKNGQYTVEHLAGVAANGNLIVFWWSPESGIWRSVDASAEAGRGGLRQATTTSWVTPNGTTNVDHVAAVSTAGDMLVFHWTSSIGHWEVTDATAESGRRVVGGLTNWSTTSGANTVEHVAGVSSTGATSVFWWSPATGAWRAVDATRIARGPAAAGGAWFLPAAPGTTKPEMVVTRSTVGGLLLHWWSSALDWQVTDLAATTGSEIGGDPVTWRLASGASAERIAVRATNGHLLVFESAGQERALVEALRAPSASTRLIHQRNLSRKVVTILWDTHKPNVPQPAKSVVQNAVVGATNSVRDYYSKNSDGRFTIENAGVLGWYDSDYPPSEYWPGGGVAGRDSGAEAIRKAAQPYDFAQYDTDNDGNLTTDELMILFVMPGTWGGGGLGRIVGEDYTTRATARGITVDGKKITWISEVSIGEPMRGIVAHELSHLLLDLGDMYFDSWFNSAEAGDFSIMDNHWTAPNIDAAQKLKLGWSHPRPILRTGRYQLADTEHGNSAWALINPARGTKEYFLIENRLKTGTYDQFIPDQGLAVWHVIEDENTWEQYPPVNVTKANWDTAGGWSRQGIRLIRPVTTAPVQQNHSLWDSTDPEAASPVTLKWADGTSSGFTLSNLSAAGPTMEATITVPAL
jgi:M6 family metalloprotease-like protein